MIEPERWWTLYDKVKVERNFDGRL